MTATSRGLYAFDMSVTVRVHDPVGQLDVEGPIDLLDGTEGTHVTSDDEDAVEGSDLPRLDEALARSAAELAAGQYVSADDVLKSLRSRS